MTILTKITPVPAQTVTLNCVIPADTHHDAVGRLRDMLNIIAEYAEQSDNADVVSLVDECYLPNDCPDSGWNMCWLHRVSIEDLLVAQMHSLNKQTDPMNMQAREDVLMRNPRLRRQMQEIHVASLRLAMDIIHESEEA